MFSLLLENHVVDKAALFPALGRQNQSFPQRKSGKTNTYPCLKQDWRLAFPLR
jgi:hypothetical protein